MNALYNIKTIQAEVTGEDWWEIKCTFALQSGISQAGENTIGLI